MGVSLKAKSSSSVLSFFWFFFFSSRRRHTRSVSAFLLNRSSDLLRSASISGYDATPFNQILKQNAKREMRLRLGKVTVARSEERRVGKECRSRWSAYRDKNNMQSSEDDRGHGDVGDASHHLVTTV